MRFALQLAPSVSFAASPLWRPSRPFPYLPLPERVAPFLVGRRNAHFFFVNQSRIKGLRLLIARVVFTRRIHIRQFAAAGPRAPRPSRRFAKASSSFAPACLFPLEVLDGLKALGEPYEGGFHLRRSQT